MLTSTYFAFYFNERPALNKRPPRMSVPFEREKITWAPQRSFRSSSFFNISSFHDGFVWNPSEV